MNSRILICTGNSHACHQDQNLYVEAEDMSKLGVLDEGVKLPNGGYYASMMVYHQLHCLVSPKVSDGANRLLTNPTRNAYIITSTRITTSPILPIQNESLIENITVSGHCTS